MATQGPGPALGPGPAMEEHLVACVQQSLGLYLFDNASFLAERLVAQFPSEVGPAAGSCCHHPPLPACRCHPPPCAARAVFSAAQSRWARPPSLAAQANFFLLATCYHRANQSYRAYHLLRGLAGEQSRYLFALCAMQLGKLTEAETALLPDNDASRVGMMTAGIGSGRSGVTCCLQWSHGQAG